METTAPPQRSWRSIARTTVWTIVFIAVALGWLGASLDYHGQVVTECKASPSLWWCKSHQGDVVRSF